MNTHYTDDLTVNNYPYYIFLDVLHFSNEIVTVYIQAILCLMLDVCHDEHDIGNLTV